MGASKLTPATLLTMREKTFRADVLMPLFKAMGYKDVVEDHGATEKGKDIVMWRREGVRERVNYAVVVKAERLTGQASGPSSSASNVVFQIQQCFNSTFRDAVTLEEQEVHECIVACTHDVSNQARDGIASALPSGLAKHVTFLSGQRLWEAIDQYLGPRTAAGKLEEAGASMEDASPNYRIVADVHGTKVVYGVEAKHPQADEVEPLLIKGNFVFPNDDVGRQAFDALDQHLKTGSPVTIPSAFIGSLEFPEFMKPFMPEGVGELVITPNPPPKKLLADLLFEVPSGQCHEMRGLVFRGVQAGTDEMTIKCEVPESPVEMVLKANGKTGMVTATFLFPFVGLNIRRAWELARFQAELSLGGSITLNHADSGLPFMTGPFEPDLTTPLDPTLIGFLGDLEFLQRRMRRQITVPDADPKQIDLQTAHEVAERLRSGIVEEAEPGLSMTTSRQYAEQLASAIEPVVAGPFVGIREESATIWGMEFSLGKVALDIQQLTVSETEQTRLQTVLAASDEASIEVRFSPMRDSSALRRIVYLDFVAPEERAKFSKYLSDDIQPPSS